MSNLQRGQACLPCRTRKVKCDGVKPVCGPCKRRGDDCQFAGELTYSQMLEQQIDTLESRLEALESLSKSSPSSSSSPPSMYPPGSFEHYPLVDGWWDFDDPPAPVRQVLVNAFLEYPDLTGFFLSIPRFRSAINASTLPVYRSHSYRALFNVVYLWGIVLSPDSRLQPYEGVYLSRAIHHNTQAISSDLLGKETRIIQTEQLLSQYFFHSGHLLEGMSHCRLAASIVIKCRYHQYRNIHQPFPQSTRVDPVDEGETINAFWISYMKDKIWASYVNTPSAFDDERREDTRVETPWPLDMAQYEVGFLQQHGQRTVETFLGDPSASYAMEDASFIAMICKASILFVQATTLATDLTLSLQHGGDFSAASIALSSFDQRLEKFYSTIAPVTPDSSMTSIRGLIVVRSLTLGAIINLNSVCEELGSPWNERCITSAIKMVSLFDNIDIYKLGYFNPLMGNMWLRAGEVLIREGLHFREFRNPSTPPSSSEELLLHTLQRLIAIMGPFARTSSYISSRRIMLQKAEEGLI